MIPLKDLNPTAKTSWATYLLVGANLLVFLLQLQIGLAEGQAASIAFIERLGLVPAYLLTPTLWSAMPISAPLTVFTSMFVHGSLLHLLGNLLYLWVFGDNVEDAMGSIRFLAFYLSCGVGAAITQAAMATDSIVPMVGASGAIAGVLGAYLVLYPRAKVLTLVFLIFFIRLIYLPAIVLLGLWFLIQLVSATGGNDVGVAWYAHVGGFVMGLLLIRSFIVRAPSPHSV